MVYPFYGFNGAWLLLLVVSIGIGLITQNYIRSTFRKWSRVPLSTGATGAQVARDVLDGAAANAEVTLGAERANGLRQVAIQAIGGNLSDNYDPRTKQLNLSQGVFAESSVAAAGVAAHEAGHAIQDAEGYVWNSVRTALVPVARFGSSSAIWLIIIGIFLRLTPLAWIGVAFYAGAVLFQLVTLPVEIDASRRAMVALRASGSMPENQLTGAREVLTAAAYTYVAGALVALLYLFYYIGLARRS